MRRCQPCERDFNRYDPACLSCGGRALRDLQAMRIPAEEKRRRLREVLEHWLKFGHDEQQLRDAAKPRR